jgi:hypothetical protein
VKPRFAQLAIGAEFLYRERQYRKVSPLEALLDGTDERRLIPRSAKIDPLLEPAAHPHTPAAGRPADATVRQAVAECLSDLHRRLTERYPPTDATQAATLATLLQVAHDDLLARLEPRHPAPHASNDATPPRQEK